MSERYDKVMDFLNRALSEMSVAIPPADYANGRCIRNCKNTADAGKILCDPCRRYLSCETDVDPVPETTYKRENSFAFDEPEEYYAPGVTLPPEFTYGFVLPSE